MKQVLIICFMFLFSGCVTSSKHSRKQDLNRLEIARDLEEYIILDADTPEKKAVLKDIKENRKQAEKIAESDPSLIEMPGQLSDISSLILGGGTGALGLLGIALSVLRSRKTKSLIEELISEPDEKECLRKVARYR